MKSIISKLFVVVAFAAALLSFSTNFGGEGFEILVNGKAVLQKYGDGMEKISTLQLSKTLPSDKITIRYYHCGKIGKNRMVTIKDGDDNTLKVFKFTDVPYAVGDMSCTIKDLMNLPLKRNTTCKVYYASTELPKGRQLALVVLPEGHNVKP